MLWLFTIRETWNAEVADVPRLRYVVVATEPLGQLLHGLHREVK